MATSVADVLEATLNSVRTELCLSSELSGDRFGPAAGSPGSTLSLSEHSPDIAEAWLDETEATSDFEHNSKLQVCLRCAL
jgi:hypothetical protein